MKRIIALLLALILCLFSCAKQDDAGTDAATDGSGNVVNGGGHTDPEGGNIDLDEDSDIAGLINAVVNTLSQDNATLTLDMSEDSESSVQTALIKADLEASSFIVSYTETYGGKSEKYTAAYDDGYAYECVQNETGLPRGTINKIDSENSPYALGLLVSLLEDRSQLTLENVIGVLSGVVFARTEGESLSVDLAAYALQSIADEQWLTDLAGFSKESKGNTVVYTVSPDIYGIANDLLSYMEDKIDAEQLTSARESLEDDKAEIEQAKLVATVKTEDGLITEIVIQYGVSIMGAQQVTRTSGPTQSSTAIANNKITLTFSDYGTTTGVADLHKTLTEAHNGHDKCVKCGQNAYFSCYCSSCAYNIFCQNYCGNMRTEDNQYCADCYTPCADCGQRHGDRKGYCYECYDKHYCNGNCGNPAVHFPSGYYGYCDDCYTPCPDCGDQGRENYNGYCYECAESKFCAECRTNAITHQFEYEGYCDDCYDPCPDCGEQGEDYYNGYCYECSRAKFCTDCKVNAITHPGKYGGGYCDDCFVPCPDCGEQGEEYYKGYCYECGRKKFCSECRENPVTHAGEYDNGYCDDCYTECSECGEQMRELINGQCYECYYNKYCHECGKNEITNGSGYAHKTCDDCYN